MQGALSYYINYICSVTLQALSEAIPPIWFNVNIEYRMSFSVSDTLLCLIVGESNKIHQGWREDYQDFLKCVVTFRLSSYNN